MSKYIVMNGTFYRVDNELYHYGVKGMKWGVRRYQNSDGTLTEEGRKRFSKESAYFGKMNAKQTDAYAKARIKARGARQALQDEDETLAKRTRKPLFAGGGMGALLGTSVGALLTGNPLVAVGAAVYGGVMGGISTTVADQLITGDNRNRQYDKNVEAIRRLADIPDTTVGTRHNVRT